MDKKQSNKYIKGASAKNIRISLENPLDIEKESQIPKLSMKFSSFSQVEILIPLINKNLNKSHYH